MVEYLSFSKGKIDVGDTVYVASGPARETLADVDGGIVLSLDGSRLVVSTKDGWQAEIDRKFLCLLRYIGHWGSPCLLCGYEESD
jgi:hypothetical protein